MIFFAVLKAAIYLVSVEDNEISVCFVEHQNTDSSAILIRDSVINFLFYISALQSESEYSTRQNF